jgi:hypothetical protein
MHASVANVGRRDDQRRFDFPKPDVSEEDVKYAP